MFNMLDKTWRQRKTISAIPTLNWTIVVGKTYIKESVDSLCTMVGVVIKEADSAIYGEDTCAPVQYVYCTLVHVHTTCSTWNHATVKAAVSSLYICLSSFCVVNSWKSNAVLLEAARERSQCPLKSNLGNVIIYTGTYQFIKMVQAS